MIAGWMAKKECRWLAKRARERQRIVEVGSWKGRSTEILTANTPGHVWAVDTWQGTPDDPGQHALYPEAVDPDKVFREFRRNMTSAIQRGVLTIVRRPSVEAAAALDAKGRRFDFVFIDADHRYESVAADIQAWRPLIIPGGLLAGHDYKETWPGVVQAVDELVPGVKTGPKSIWRVHV